MTFFVLWHAIYEQSGNDTYVYKHSIDPAGKIVEELNSNVRRTK